MPTVSFEVNASDLLELKKTLSSTKLNQGLAVGIVDVANSLHAALANGVATRYAGRQDIVTVLKGKRAFASAEGHNLVATLTYEYKSRDLSKFPYSPKIIPNRYAEHTVSVLRGNSRLVRGKSGNGGFVPRKGPNHPTEPNKAWQAWKKGTRMFERIGKSRLPLRVLYGPSLSQMTHNVLTVNPTTAVNEVLNNLDKLLLERIAL